MCCENLQHQHGQQWCRKNSTYAENVGHHSGRPSRGEVVSGEVDPDKCKQAHCNSAQTICDAWNDVTLWCKFLHNIRSVLHDVEKTDWRPTYGRGITIPSAPRQLTYHRHVILVQDPIALGYHGDHNTAQLHVLPFAFLLHLDFLSRVGSEEIFDAFGLGQWTTFNCICSFAISGLTVISQSSLPYQGHKSEWASA